MQETKFCFQRCPYFKQRKENMESHPRSKIQNTGNAWGRRSMQHLPPKHGQNQGTIYQLGEEGNRPSADQMRLTNLQLGYPSGNHNFLRSLMMSMITDRLAAQTRATKICQYPLQCHCVACRSKGASICSLMLWDDLDSQICSRI